MKGEVCKEKLISTLTRRREEKTGSTQRLGWQSGRESQTMNQQKKRVQNQSTKGNFKIAEMWDTRCEKPKTSTYYGCGLVD